jgi:hypothetical protein
MIIIIIIITTITIIVDIIIINTAVWIMINIKTIQLRFTQFLIKYVWMSYVHI